MRSFRSLASTLLLLCLGLSPMSAVAQSPAPAVEAPQPLKVLLITGGCCHDYTSQKQLIKKGLEARSHVEVTVVQQGGSTTNTKIPLYEDPNWADGYDVVIHDECFAAVDDPSWTQRVLKPHQQGTPAVVVHCAMHCYRDGTDEWFKFCGVTSRRHGAHYAHEVLNRDASHPVMAEFPAAWANPAGELYWIEKVWPTAHPLASAKNREKGNEEVCVWTNDYQGTRVFGTTLGHHNETVSADEFLNLLTRGTLWAAGHLDDAYLKPQVPREVPVNVAQGAKVTASSEETGKGNLAGLSVDGNPQTRWCASGATFPQTLTVDLGKSQPLNGCRILWERPAGVYGFLLEASEDGKQWTAVADQRAAKQATETVEFQTEARWLRLTITGSNGGWASIWELEAFGEETRIEDPQAEKQRAMEKYLADVEVPEGFRATLFAAPPAVNYPVFVSADVNGTVYVSVDKNGSLDREPRRGAIYRLRDLDRDGQADEVKLFVADVDSPRGLVWDRDRLYVLHPPHLSAFIDEDGDGISDRQQILVKDLAFTFADRPADHTSNGVTLGADGWLYLAIGDFGFMKATGSDGTELGFRGGGVVRVRPDGTQLEIYSRGTRNILEVGLDPRLNGFARDNTNDGGGWDVRLHHFSGLEDHGYPTRYMNFSNEIIAPLADYGGGSGCGACYVAEPGFPEGMGDALYTADWGREWIYRHTMTRNGATFQADQQPFIRVPRVTDLDVDGSSRMYVTSWKGASFRYVGEEVGYVLQLVPETAGPSSVFVAKTASLDELVMRLRSPSHRQRLAAQRELLQRGWDESTRQALVTLAGDSEAMIESRIVAIFTLSLGVGADAAKDLLPLAFSPELLPYVCRALSELPADQQPPTPLRVLQAALVDENPVTRLEAIKAVVRFKADTLAAAMVDRLWDADPVVAHTARRACIALGVSEELLSRWKRLDGDREPLVLTLQSIHDQPTSQALIEALASADSQRGEEITRMLARQMWVEGTWNGASWGTRPDTRGPYYQPEPWGGSEAIEQAMVSRVGTLPADALQSTTQLLIANRWTQPEVGEVLMKRAASEAQARQPLIEWLSVQGSVPDAAVTLLAEWTRDGAVAADALAAAIELQWNSDAVDLSAVLTGLERLRVTEPQGFVEVWGSLRRPNRLRRQQGKLLAAWKETQDESRVWLTAMLLGLEAEPGGQTATPAEVARAIQSLWQDEEGALELLAAIELTGETRFEDRVWQAAGREEASVKQRALKLADAWKLEPLTSAPGPKVSSLEPGQVIEQSARPTGEEERGRRWFARLNCANCHTVSPNQPARGPYLPNVARTYQRNQLAEAILEPSKTLAQGFVTEVFVLVDGTQLTGFVTQEAATEIVIRDAAGHEIELSVEDIEERAQQKISVMPTGLANELSVADFNALLDYLQSLGSVADQP